jgi:hypothetical protein
VHLIYIFEYVPVILKESIEFLFEGSHQ